MPCSIRPGGITKVCEKQLKVACLHMKDVLRFRAQLLPSLDFVLASTAGLKQGAQGLRATLVVSSTQKPVETAWGLTSDFESTDLSGWACAISLIALREPIL